MNKISNFIIYCFTILMSTFLLQTTFATNDTTRYLKIGIKMGYQQFKMKDWEYQTDAYNYKKNITAAALELNYKPNKGRMFFDFYAGYGNQKKTNIPISFDIQEFSLGQPSSMCYVLKDYNLKTYFIGASPSIGFDIGDSFLFSMGLGINYYYTNLKLQYISDPQFYGQGSGLYSRTSIQKTNENLVGGELGIQANAALYLKLSSKINLSARCSYINNNKKGLKMEVDPADSFIAYMAKNNMSYEGLYYNIGLFYKFDLKNK